MIGHIQLKAKLTVIIIVVKSFIHPRPDLVRLGAFSITVALAEGRLVEVGDLETRFCELLQ